ncbi:radical SAM protein [Candidatus Bathyarchaeota archaeon]|nr:radical SAM protein [Candidatus Bathyarchaeota archaeon]
MTSIYHITYYTYDNSIYIFFQGCNFQCKGCILKQLIWDCHLNNENQHALQAVKDLRKLSLSEFKDIIKGFDVKKAILGGGEPTIDKELPDIINVLNALGVKTRLLTNGYLINEDFIKKLEEAGLSSICISIKAYDDDIHQFYTGKSNKPVLNNFKILDKSQIELMAESVLIPELIEYNEIKRIAKFIAGIRSSIPYRIDAFIPINDASWRAPSLEEVIKASKIAKRYLKKVHYIYNKTKIKGEVINIYPKIKAR